MRWFARLPVAALILASPAWAREMPPLAGRLLYSRLTDGTWQIWQADMATGEQAQLTDTAGDKRYPAWRADGAVTYHTSNHAAFLLSAGRKAGEPLFTELSPVRDLMWSSDGQRAVVARFRTDVIDSANIWVANRQGEDLRIITTEPGIQYNPAWSPDGTRLVYVGGQGFGTYELYVISADGTNRRRLTTNASHEFLPAWSPDGAKIAFASDAGGDFDIWVVKTDGSGLTQLTRSPGLDTRPAWSPDSRHIAFTTNRSGVLEIWVMDEDGTDQRLLERGEGGVCDPAWAS